MLAFVGYLQGELAMEHYHWVKSMQETALKVAENFGSNCIEGSEKLDGSNLMVVQVVGLDEVRVVGLTRPLILFFNSSLGDD